jgi:hypothetical protein
MNNLFLLNESLETTTILEFELGISNLNEIVERREPLRDNLLMHHSLLNHLTKNGYVGEIVNSSSKGKLFWTIFRSLKKHENYFSNENEIDNEFKNECNGFLGFDFSMTSICKGKQITNLDTFEFFTNSCTQNHGQETIAQFWENKGEYYKGLVFCDNILDYLNKFSVDDDRFLLLKEKLKRLNECAIEWEVKEFPHYSMGIQVSPDTRMRLNKSASTRIYTCPDGKNRLFSWHIKLSVKTEYRIYYYPDAESRKVIVGVIGTKPELGF